MRTEQDIISQIKNISKRLCDYDNLLQITNDKKNYRMVYDYTVRPWNELALSNGIPGLCMLYAELSNNFPGEDWEMEGHKYLSRIVDCIREQGLISASMFSGGAGIGLAALCLSANGTKYTNFIHSINAYIIKMLPNILTMERKDGAIISHYDVMEGISGVLSYLLLQKDQNEILSCLKESIQYLINLTKDFQYHNNEIPGWYVSSKNQFSSVESEEYPEGNFNTSMSHGAAGIMSALSLAIIEGIELEGQRSAIRRILEFLDSYKIKEERIFWKGQISLKEYLNKEMIRNDNARRDAWCYGNIGIAYAMILAGGALGEQRPQKQGIQILHDTVKDIRGVFSPSFCHGFSGILQTLNSVEKIIHKEEFSKEKEQLQTKILSFYEEDYVFGFRNVEIDRNVIKKFDAIGILDGVCGTCLTLLDNNCTQKTPWSRAFMLV